jgi:hypothetical protein
MRLIKFRGRDLETGEYRYGSLVDYGDGHHRYWINPIGGERNYPVDPETVKQLAYVDASGKEYYEGDVMEKEGRRWRVSLYMKWGEL